MMEEFKQLMNYGKDEWVLPGYSVAKTKHYNSKSISFSPSKKGNVKTILETERASFPEPSKYSDTYEKAFSRNWKKPNGGFSKLKKTIFLDEAIKRSKSNPGPGSYHKIQTNKSIDTNINRSLLGKFE